MELIVYAHSNILLLKSKIDQRQNTAIESYFEYQHLKPPRAKTKNNPAIKIDNQY